MSAVTLERPWLSFDLGAPMQVLSWALNRPGRVTASRILWREVRNADLTPDLDVPGWLQDELAAREAADAVCFLTSRDLTHFTQSRARAGDVTAHAVATVGFSNAERVGHRIDRTGKDWGTINIALRVSEGVTESALLEVLSIVVQARTAAVIDTRMPLPSGPATGTGTDCVAVAAPEGAGQYAGLHTDLGEAAGRATYDAVLSAARHWMATQYRPDEVLRERTGS